MDDPDDRMNKTGQVNSPELKIVLTAVLTVDTVPARNITPLPLWNDLPHVSLGTIICCSLLIGCSLTITPMKQSNQHRPTNKLTTPRRWSSFGPACEMKFTMSGSSLAAMPPCCRAKFNATSWQRRREATPATAPCSVDCSGLLNCGGSETVCC